MSTILYLVRHGEPERGIDEPLTTVGRQLSSILAGLLQSRLVGGSIELFCGPSLRTQETAEIIGQSLGLQHRVSQALRETALGQEIHTMAQGLRSDHAVLVTHESGVQNLLILIGTAVNLVQADDLYMRLQSKRLGYAEAVVIDPNLGSIELIEQP
jgi:phosphohistidine phosphatase SixA